MHLRLMGEFVLREVSVFAQRTNVFAYDFPQVHASTGTQSGPPIE